MIPHNRPEESPISFFSFLSVISCTIGPLMLVLVCITVISFWGADLEFEAPSVKGGDVNRRRVYVECCKEGLVVLPDEPVVTLEDLEDPRRWIHGPYGRCLNELAGGRNGGALHFFIRRDGMPVYNKAVKYAMAVGGGTTDGVADGGAVFSLGRQLVLMPGTLRIPEKECLEPTEADNEVTP